MNETITAGVELAGGEPGSLMWVIRQALRDQEGLLSYIYEGRGLNRLLLSLLGINGAGLASYGVILGLTGGWAQIISSAIKLPMLYLLSLAVCFPVLFVVNVLWSQLNLRQTLGLILAALSLNSLIIVSCVPIGLFFWLTGADYHFLKLMHVGILGFAGLWAMAGLYRALVHMCENSSVYPKTAIRILLVWICVFGFVGTQMAWTLRPFLGAPDLPFELIRHNGNGNFYTAIAQSIHNLD